MADSFDFVRENYLRIAQKVSSSAAKAGRSADDITIVAATKTVSAPLINFAFECGLRHFGENRVQEFLSKNDEVNNGFCRHFIGNLQTNKVKDIVGEVALIQSVDSVKLAGEISKRSLQKNITSEILVEINIGSEEAKGGISPHSLDEFLGEISCFEGIIVRGLMTLGPIFEDYSQKSKYFKEMNKLFVDNKGQNKDNVFMDILSMGMSDDYDLAIELGANMIRVGSALFGKRG